MWEDLIQGENKEEVIKSIKQEIAKEFIPKSEFNKKNEELKSTQELLKARDTQLDELKEQVQGNEELTKKIEELEKQNKETETEYQERLNKMNKDIVVTKQILSNEKQFHDVDLVKNLIDMDSIAINDDGIHGLKEQLEKIVEDKPFLVKEEEETTPITTGTGKSKEKSNDGKPSYYDFL